MAQIPPIDDSYIDDIIKAQDVYNPGLNKTQGVKLRALVKLLRDRLEQEAAGLSDGKVDKQSGYQLSQENYSPEEKSKLGSLHEHFRGYYISVEALTAAVSAGSAGDYAFVDLGPDTNAQMYVWDTSDNKWVASAGGSNVLDTVLTGIDFDSVAAVLATDNILTAFGKLQAQLNDLFKIPVGGTAGQVLTKIDGTDGNLHWANGAGGGYISHTYAELKELIDAAGLIPGQQYLLTDYNTQYKLSTQVDPYPTFEYKMDAPVEPLILSAISEDKFAKNIISINYPKDVLEYDFNDNVLIPGTPIIPGTYGAQVQQTEVLPGIGDLWVGIWVTSDIYGDVLIDVRSMAELNVNNDPLPGFSYPVEKTYSAYKVGVFTKDPVYSGSGFNILINGVVYPVSPAQVASVTGQEYPFPGKSVIASFHGNVCAQVYATNIPEYIPLPDTSQDIPATGDTIRPGWITRRIDTDGNDTYLDHRNVLVWSVITPGSAGMSISSITGPRLLDESVRLPYDDMYLTINHTCTTRVVESRFGAFDNGSELQTISTPFDVRTDTYFVVSAFGKCDVESYCLINGVSYTIPPFENSQAELVDTMHPAPPPIASILAKFCIVQFYTDINNPPQYAVDAGLVTTGYDGYPSVYGERKIFSDGCRNNVITKSPVQNEPPLITPYLSLGENCVANKIEVGNSWTFENVLGAGSSYNELISSSVMCAQGAFINRDKYQNGFVTVNADSSDNIIINSFGNLNGRGNYMYNSEFFTITGNNNKSTGGFAHFVIGNDNELVYNMTTGSTFSTIIGNGNKFHGDFAARPIIVGNNNDFYSLDTFDPYNYIIGSYNIFRGQRYTTKVFGNNNFFDQPMTDRWIVTLEGNYNTIKGNSQLLVTGRSFNNNTLLDVSQSSFGKDCSNNIILGGNGVEFGDNYSNHNPYGGVLPKESILPNDPRLTNNNGTWTLLWDAVLVSKFGLDEASFKVLFDNGDGTYKEQKDIPPDYSYTVGLVTSISFEIAIEVQFKIIITR
jgi:hypothetical protein